jgi:hypothetical protein
VEFGFSTLWLVNIPQIGGTTCCFHDPACCPQTWERARVMERAVKMLDVGGNGAGSPENHILSSLKKLSFAVRCLIEGN